MAAAPAKPPGPRDGGWLLRPVLLAVERVARGRAHRVPLVAAGATLVFVAAVMSTMMIGRGEDAPEEACLGTNDDEDYCDDRGDAAPVVSYSGVLWPERAVFIALGTPCGVLWFVTILLSHASLLRLADAAWARRRGGRETAFDGRATNDDHRPSSSSSSPSAANAAPTPTPTPKETPKEKARREKRARAAALEKEAAALRAAAEGDSDSDSDDDDAEEEGANDGEEGDWGERWSTDEDEEDAALDAALAGTDDDEDEDEDEPSSSEEEEDEPSLSPPTRRHSEPATTTTTTTTGKTSLMDKMRAKLRRVLYAGPHTAALAW